MAIIFAIVAYKYGNEVIAVSKNELEVLDEDGSNDYSDKKEE